MKNIPISAQAKLAHLEQTAQDAFALLQAAGKTIADLEIDLRNAAHRVNVFGPDEPARQAAQELADTTKGKLEAARSTQEARRATHKAAAQTLAQVRDWLARNEKKYFEVAPSATLKGDEDLSLIREEIKKTKAELVTVGNSRLSNAELKAQAAEDVKQLAVKGKPELRGLDKGLTLDVLDSSGLAPIVKPHPLCVAAWIDPKAVLAAFERDIDLLPGQGMDSAEKASRQGTLRVRLVELELIEEALIVAAVDAGQMIARRKDASPLAILGIQPTAVRKSKAA